MSVSFINTDVSLIWMIWFIWGTLTQSLPRYQHVFFHVDHLCIFVSKFKTLWFSHGYIGKWRLAHILAQDLSFFFCFLRGSGHYLGVYVYVCIYVWCTYVYMYVWWCMYVWMYVCVYVCMYIYVCMCVYMYVCLLVLSEVPTHIFPLWPPIHFVGGLKRCDFRIYVLEVGAWELRVFGWTCIAAISFIFL